MKKVLPFIILGVGILGVIGIFVFLAKGKQPSSSLEEDQTEVIPEIKTAEAPFTSLTPMLDSHGTTLKLDIKNIKVAASSLDYELIYKTADNRQQGVPGTIQLNGKTEIQRDLYLGSESSGKFRPDVGVKDGTLTLKFRNSSGKLLGQLTSDFKLLSGDAQLVSSDSTLKFDLVKSAPKTSFVIIKTFGLPTSAPGTIVSGPYGIFASDSLSHKGTVTLSGSKIYTWSGSAWETIDTSAAIEPSVFISTN